MWLLDAFPFCDYTTRTTHRHHHQQAKQQKTTATKYKPLWWKFTMMVEKCQNGWNYLNDGRQIIHDDDKSSAAFIRQWASKTSNCWFHDGEISSNKTTIHHKTCFQCFNLFAGLQTVTRTLAVPHELVSFWWLPGRHTFPNEYTI